jgi:hypothetical protein
LILGSRDNFTNEKALRNLVSSFDTETTTGAILKGADHFFHKRESGVMSIIATWLVTTYPACQGNPANLRKLELHPFITLHNTTEETSAGSSALCGCDLGQVL